MNDNNNDFSDVPTIVSSRSCYRGVLVAIITMIKGTDVITTFFRSVSAYKHVSKYKFGFGLYMLVNKEEDDGEYNLIIQTTSIKSALLFYLAVIIAVKLRFR